MYKTIYRTIYALLAASLLLISLPGCSSLEDDFQPDPFYPSGGATSDRTVSDESRDIFILWSLGFNNLSSYLKEDLNDIASNWLPVKGRNKDMVLAFCHNTAGAYSVQTSPVLIQLYKDFNGLTHRDTLMVLPKETISASAETMHEVLSYIKERFPAKGYSMLVSSHGTGWVPEGYCNNPSSYENTMYSLRRTRRGPVPYVEIPAEEGMPLTKSIGCQNISSKQVYEMDITDMAEAIPMHLDYLIFDACFMGGVEVAYELREKCDRMIFSQTEILADGMDYATMLSYLMEEETPDLVGYCENYFNYYNNQSGAYKSATISLVDCTRLDPLAEACSDIFESRRSEIAALEGKSTIQKYYRSGLTQHSWFFDLKSIISSCSASEDQVRKVEDALEGCIIYKAATAEFMQSFAINTHSGLSMYLPYRKRNYLNSFYKELKWNKDTGLIK